MAADASETSRAKSSRAIPPSLPKNGTSGTAMIGVAQTSQSYGIVSG